MANIIPALPNDALGTTNNPWRNVTSKKIELIPNAQPSSTANSLYIQDGVLYFDGSPIGSSVSSTKWKAYELLLEQEFETTCEVWVAGASISADDPNYPAQARVLYNGVELAPSSLTFEVGEYGVLFDIPPESLSDIDPTEQGTKITINIPDENGQSFIFEIGASIIVWNNE